MSNWSSRQIRDALLVFGISTAALVVVWVIGARMQANRSAQPEPAAQEDVARDPNAPLTVRLDRADLSMAAGIEVTPVESRPLRATITCNGGVSFNLNKYVKVPPKADGILKKINVDVGTPVRAGDVLAVVSSPVLGDLKASYIKALVHQEHLRWQIEKFTAAAEGIAAKNLIETRHQLEEELADTARIRNRLETFGLSADDIDRRVGKERDLSTELAVISPREGVVVERHAVEGEPAQTTVSLFAVADLGTMWIRLHVYENNLASVHLGQKMTFFPDGLPAQGFDGLVTWISPEVDHETRSLLLRAEVANPAAALKANMYGKAELVVDQARERLVVPEEAIQSHDGNHVVFVQQPDNVFEARRVVIGLKDGKSWEVVSGVKAGEQVATTGSFLLKSNLENPDFGKVEDE